MSTYSVPTAITPSLASVPTVRYLRVSTAKQAADDKFGLDVQETMCSAYQTRSNLRVIETYVDVITGTRATRQALDRLLREAPGRGARAILISTVDRLGRRASISYAVLEELADTGLVLHSTDMGVVDLEDEGSAVNFGVRTLFADIDHRRLTRKLYDGRLAKARGRDGKPGQPPLPLYAFGWVKGQLDEAQAARVRWMFDSVRETPLMEIARELNAANVPQSLGGDGWRAATVHRILRNPLYKGEYQYGRRGERVIVPVPAIVTHEAWEAAQVAMRSRRRNAARAGRRTDVYGLQGRIRCAVCSHRMGGNGRDVRTPTPRHYYMCRRTLVSETAPRCSNTGSLRVERVHEAIRAALQQLVTDDAALARAIRAAPAPIAPDTTSERERALARYQRVRDGHLAGVYELDDVRSEKRRLDATLAALEIQAGPQTAPAPDLPAARARVRAALLEGTTFDLARAAGLTVIAHPGGQLELVLDP